MPSNPNPDILENSSSKPASSKPKSKSAEAATQPNPPSTTTSRQSSSSESNILLKNCVDKNFLSPTKNFENVSDVFSSSKQRKVTDIPTGDVLVPKGGTRKVIDVPRGKVKLSTSTSQGPVRKSERNRKPVNRFDPSP
jgi:hypothetical protein